ncbi:At2g23090 like protein [Filobasidium floriforme]|uniref:At2g23090 like protein n=1 Tax=Filobasidium floriforme TaxID=5210 RepID=UPI001E8D70FA|nr:At2g23090 like protein [Filobasidium floriforme]KAH8088176.1 At2g23090 like protein [Filobasidium floriforme]
MGNGAKAEQKRERNAKNAPAKGASSQLKANAAAQTTICKKCFRTFQSTAGQAKLTEHSDTHNKPFAECFPDFGK